MTPTLRKILFETLYKNPYLYRFASAVPFAGQWRVWQRLVLPRLQGHDVLELGCGLGDLLADILAAGYNCHAVECSPAMVAAARKTLQKRKVGKSTDITQGSTQYLPFSNEMFDTVVSTFPSEYIYDRNTIAEIKRVLRPGGRVIILEAANLLPTGYVQPVLLLIHAIVYGPSPLFNRYIPKEHSTTSSRTTRNTDDTIISTEYIPNAHFGHFIPLELFGLQRHSERVHNHRWEVYITIGEKRESNAV
jgi:ubiquinone/menaquinone biosynthesis C-methylase UbiE